MKILVVDDESTMRRLAQYNLELAGHEVLLAETAEEGLALARSEQPNLILQDVMLPGMDGFEALTELKNDSATLAIPVVMLTAKGQRTDVEQAMEAGAAGYITKPFDPSRFTLLVEEYARP